MTRETENRIRKFGKFEALFASAWQKLPPTLNPLLLATRTQAPYTVRLGIAWATSTMHCLCLIIIKTSSTLRWLRQSCNMSSPHMIFNSSRINISTVLFLDQLCSQRTLWKWTRSSWVFRMQTSGQQPWSRVQLTPAVGNNFSRNTTLEGCPV